MITLEMCLKLTNLSHMKDELKTFLLLDYYIVKYNTHITDL